MSTIRRKIIIIGVILLVLISSGFVSGAKPRVIVLSNSIDYELASEFFGFLGNKGMDVIHVSAIDFEQYKEEKFVVILGGPDAYEGVGDIVQGVLTSDEQDYVRASGNRKMFTKTNVWTNGQRVSVIAGSDRDQTKFAHVENRDQLNAGIQGDFQTQQSEIEPEQRNLSVSWGYQELLELEGVTVKLGLVSDPISTYNLPQLIDVYVFYRGPEREKYDIPHDLSSIGWTPDMEGGFTKINIEINSTLDEELDFIFTLQDSKGNYYIPYISSIGGLKIPPSSSLKTRTIYFNPMLSFGEDFTLTVVLYGKDKRTYEIMW